MTNKIKQNLRDAWSNIDSETLRKVYWRINRETNHPRIKIFVSDDSIKDSLMDCASSDPGVL